MPGNAADEQLAHERAEGAADDEDRRERAARRSRGECDPPDHQLADAERGQRAQGEPPGECVVDHVVADAERTRHEQTERRPHQRPHDRVPGLLHRELAEDALDGEQTACDEDGEETASKAERGVERKLPETTEVVRRHREERPIAQQERVHAAGDARRDDQRDERSGENSNSRSSIASTTAAKGVPNVAAMPAAAPHASRIFRSLAETWITWPTSEPIAPPVTMIGPSAPNGPPVPIATAADSGLATAVLGATRLRRVRIASIASGMPCPLMIGAHRAISVTTAPPAIAVSTTSGPMSSVAKFGRVVPH